MPRISFILSYPHIKHLSIIFLIFILFLIEEKEGCQEKMDAFLVHFMEQNFLFTDLLSLNFLWQ
jgi:hypothetical protein